MHVFTDIQGSHSVKSYNSCHIFKPGRRGSCCCPSHNLIQREGLMPQLCCGKPGKHMLHARACNMSLVVRNPAWL